jgi:hypothetical protein
VVLRGRGRLYAPLLLHLLFDQLLSVASRVWRLS